MKDKFINTFPNVTAAEVEQFILLNISISRDDELPRNSF